MIYVVHAAVDAVAAIAVNAHIPLSTERTGAATATQLRKITSET